MKKRFLSIILALILAFTCFALVGCGNTVEGLFGPYEPAVKPDEVAYMLDEGMTLDGKADEAEWKKENQSWVTYTSTYNNIEVDYTLTSCFGTNGMYFYAECNDTIINVRPAMYATQKTAIAFTVCAEETPDGKTINNCATEFTVAPDGDYLVQKYIENTWTLMDDYNNVGIGVRVINAQPIDETGSGTADGYAVEVFIPWSVIALEEEPEQIRMRLAGIRFNSPYATVRDYQVLDSVTTAKHKNWLVYTDNGAPVVKSTADGYIIDGKDDDWTDYTGYEKHVDIYSVDGNGNKTAEDTDQRYVSYKMRKHADGLLIYTEALQRIFLDYGGLAYMSTHIELFLVDRDGERVQLFVTNNAVPAFHQAKFSVEETDETLASTGEKLKKISIEWFIPDYVLKNILGVDTDGETIQAAMVFRNGQYQPGDSATTMDLNCCETILKQHELAPSSQPFLFFADYVPYTGDFRNVFEHVGAGGIIRNDD